jgi:hypothetical protein
MRQMVHLRGSMRGQRLSFKLTAKRSRGAGASCRRDDDHAKARCVATLSVFGLRVTISRLSPKDMKGQTIRVQESPTYIAFMKDLGAKLEEGLGTILQHAMDVLGRFSTPAGVLGEQWLHPAAGSRGLVSTRAGDWGGGLPGGEEALGSECGRLRRADGGQGRGDGAGGRWWGLRSALG